MQAHQLNRNQLIHKIYSDGYISVDDFLEQIIFLYRNVAQKEKYYIKMMNKYEYINSGNHNEMIRLDKLIRRNYVDWYLHKERKNKYASQRPDVIDFYHSLNLYGNKKVSDSKRKISMASDNIEILIGLMIDIDIKESIFSNINPYDVYKFLVEEKILNGVVPGVNAIIVSGAGLHLITKFKYPIPATEKTKVLINNMQDCFRKEIEDQLVIKHRNNFKTDKLSITTSTRVNTSYNSKNFEKVKFLLVNEELMELSKLQEAFDKIKPYSREKNKPKKLFYIGSNKSTKKAQKTYILLEDRKNDLIKLQLEYSENCESYEEKMCFLYCNFTLQQLIHNYVDTQLHENVAFEDIELTIEKRKELFMIAYEETIEFNNRFKKPYKPRQLRSKMNTLTKKDYKFTTQTIIAWLDIPPSIQWKLKTIAMDSVVKARNKERMRIISQQRKANRRNSNGLTLKQQELVHLKETILKIKQKEPTISNRELARRLAISESKVRTTLKK